MNLFYGELAAWWPLISPVEEYVDEAQVLLELIQARRPAARDLLELGSGGGHLAHHLAPHFQLTLSDLSAAMIEVSARLNPSATHVVGDMRALELDRTFDVVLAHDALDYLLTEEDLRATFQVAIRHLRPGGLVVLVPDAVRERYQPGTDLGGADAEDGRAARYLEWNEPAGPPGAPVLTHYAFLLRGADGQVATHAERHACGLFPESTWLRCLAEAGFEPEVIDEPPNGEHEPRRIFFGHKPGVA